jgi:FAD/FMN-containing dehydrogenase
LEPHGVSVVGARVTGIGVAGFILGGGYSWKTNQYGLAIDTVQAFELVLPDGNITTVTPTSNVDLFFGLRV